MALGTSLINAPSSPRGEVVRPASILGQWRNVLDAGGPAVQDAATITNPTTQIVNSTTHIINVDNGATFCALRLGYDDGLTGITDPVVKVFGRTKTDVWQLLKTRAASLTGTLTTAATDVADGTLFYTTPDIETHVWDCFGCEEIIVGVETALAGTGTTSNAVVQAKLF